MAMNIPSPIQLLRGTHKSIVGSSKAAGSLFMDSDTGTLLVHTGDSLNIIARMFNDPIASPTIYVDAERGDDSNSGFSSESPVKTIDRALCLTGAINSVFIPTINLAAGTYDTEVVELPNCIVMGDSMDTTFINMSYFKNESKFVSINNVTISVTKVDFNTIAFSSYEGTLHILNSRLKASGAVNAVLYGGDNSYVYVSKLELDLTDITGKSIISANFSSAVNLHGLSIKGNASIEYTVFAFGNSYVYISPTEPIVNNGTVDGSRYRVVYGSILVTEGQGATAIPGTSEGTTASNGYYY